MTDIAYISLRRHFYTLAFVDEFGPLYALYTLWFVDNGIDAAQISTVFLTWAVVAIVFEIPSGALADRVDRRTLVAVAFVLRAIGISLWLIWPVYPVILLGAALWAVHSAFASGTWEAMIHDELSALGRDDRYAVVTARISQFSNMGIACGAIVAAFSVRAGLGLEALGWITVATHVVSIALILKLPNVRWAASGDDDMPWSYSAWWSTLRTGVAQARRLPLLMEMIVIGALLEGLFILDEFVALISRERGATNAAVPVIVLIVWFGLIAGGELAARHPALSGRAMGSMLLVGTVAMFTALLADGPWALTLIGIGYFALETAWVLSGARMQERTPTATRATVTSVRGFSSGVVAALAFAVVGAMSDGDDPSPGLYVVVAALAVCAILIYRWIPPALAPADKAAEAETVG